LLPFSLAETSTVEAHVEACAYVATLSKAQALSQEVAHYLGMNLSGIKIKRFADGEIYVQILVSGSLVARRGSAFKKYAAHVRVVRALTI
jgi:hypothetical protein